MKHVGLSMLLALGLAAIPATRPTLAADASGLAADAELVEMRTEVPKLKAAAEYKAKDGVVEIELSEYAGYAGLIVANGGLEPNEDSPFFKKHGFKLKIKLSEEESWSPLNSGRIGASATTVDVLVPYSRQMDVVVPLLISFSRGADGIVVKTDVPRINNLKGKTLSCCQFTESDFLIRYLAQEAGMGVNMLADLGTKPDPQKVNLVFCADAFGAGDIFLRDLKAGRSRLAGCVTWAPKTTEVADGSGGKAKILTTNRNLLIVADILIVNRAFAKENPKILAGLVEGIMEGNQKVRANPAQYTDLIAQAFKWKPENVKGELAKVHFANLPENLAFFSGELDSAGSYTYIYETAGYVYGSELLGKIADADKFPSLDALKALDKAGTFKDQKASISPIRSSVGKAETSLSEEESLLSKDIKFMFSPNASKLESGKKENTKGLEAIAQLLKVSPGSRVLLRGHADGSRVEEFRKKGGEAQAREARLALKNLSKARCAEIKQILQETYRVDAARMEAQGVGCDEPTGQGPDADRRVEVQWFTVE
jgi:NitT/TauT family transport system substrate-binding protein